MKIWEIGLPLALIATCALGVVFMIRDLLQPRRGINVILFLRARRND
jgi:hypothetical protein